MRRFILMRTKKLFLFAVIFAFLAGNMCFSEEIKITTIVPNEERIIVGTVSSEMDDGDTVFGDGFSVDYWKSLANDWYYTITFLPAFSAVPTVVCTYLLQPAGFDETAKSQIAGYPPTASEITIGVVETTGHDYVDKGSLTFIAIGPR